MIGVMDYGMGNLHSVCNALHHIGVPCEIFRDPDMCGTYTGLILPGVGAFPDAMRALEASGLADRVRTCAGAGQPLLGICLGMQLLFEESTEFGTTKGLGLIPGRVTRIRAPGLKIPHMGWNSLHVWTPDDPLASHIREGDYVYFVHSYKAETGTENLIASTEYGERIPALVRAPGLPVYGAQFHPEKSHEPGLGILKDFTSLCGEVPNP